MKSLLVIILFLVGVCPVFAENTPFSNGETIYYSIHKFGLSGKATLVFQGPQEYKNKQTLLILFTSQAFNFYDQERIYLDPKSFRPLFVERDINIFGNKEKIFEEYLPQQSQIKIIKNVRGKETQQIINVKGDVDNIYGFIYRYRLQGTFKIGNIMAMHLPTQDIKIKLTKEMQVRAARQTFDSFYMESDPAKYQLWFGQDAKKLPLKISGADGIGSTVMIMTDYKE